MEAQAATPTDLASPPIDYGAFRNALARLASGVAIVAAWHGGRPHGLLVSSLTGLSLDPPRLLFCLRKETACHDAILAARSCSVTILGQGERSEAECFSSAALADQRFLSSRWHVGKEGAPLFEGGVARFLCQLGGTMDAGTHTVVMLDVNDVASAAGQPLVYFERAYRGLDA